VPRSDMRRRTHDSDSIVRIAFSLFRERGYDATTIDQVAVRAGVTKAAIYYHVAGKEQILLNGVTRALDALFAVLEDPRVTAESASPISRLEQILRAAVEVELDHLDEVTVLLRLRGNTPVEREVMKRRREFDDAVAHVVEDAVERGEARDDLDPHIAARLIFGMANSLTEWIRPAGPVPRERIVEAVVGIARRGLSTE
jgi:AcrR family transcriptional regulator